MKPFLAILLAMFFMCSLTAHAQTGAIEIGSRRELFIDDFLIDKMFGVALRLNTPKDEGSVLAFDEPWEGAFCAYVTVIHSDDKYQMFYRGAGDAKTDEKTQVTCYAESRDGIKWTKPEFDFFPRSGHARTNIIIADAGTVTHDFSPFVDTKPGVEPDQRYKGVGGYENTGLYAYISPDGIHWRKLQDKPALTKAEVFKSFVFDSQNVPFWSEAEQKYLLYYRCYKDKTRRIARVESTDFIHWKNSALMEYERGGNPAPIEQLYTNQTHPYFRAPHIYIATAARFMLGRRVLTTQQAEAIHVDPSYFYDISDAILMTSRGGNVYQRTFMSAFITPGIGAQNWVSRTNYPALNVVQTGPTEMSLYANQNYAQPTACLHRYSLRLDGFASVRAEYDGGEMITRPVKFNGSALFLNFSTSAAGGVRAELQDPDGTAIPGYSLADCQEMIGNEIERPVSWKGGDLEKLAGRSVRVRFVMKDADMYALRFGNAPSMLSSEQRSQLIEILRHGLDQRGKWISVHAAEALIAIHRPAGVIEAFESQAEISEPQYRIGVWRVLAQTAPIVEQHEKYVRRIKGVLLDASAPDRLHAMEALAKLNEPIVGDSERRVVQEAAAQAGVAKPYALCRLAQEKNTDAVGSLVALLRDPDTATRARAAYVLGKLAPLPTSITEYLKRALADEPIDSPARPALAAAVGGEEIRRLTTNAVLPPARYAAAMYLANRGTSDDQACLWELQKDSDEDVRVASAFALLRIDLKAIATTAPSR